MAIRGFGNTPGNFRLGKPLTLGQNKQQEEVQKEEAKKEEPLKLDATPAKLSPVQVKFDKVDSFLLEKGIKIGKTKNKEEDEAKPTLLRKPPHGISEKDWKKFVIYCSMKNPEELYGYTDSNNVVHLYQNGEEIKTIQR